ncbi:MAG: PAS domain S-box protein, partial [Ignavibacteria bacterium]|nr:PAS domain S-box protein [Ignavibacteria bacterium]
ENERAYFKHLFESVPFGIVVLDENERVLVNNNMFTEMFGYESSQINNQPIDDFIVSEAYKEEGKKLTNKVIEGLGIISETKRLKSDGTLLDVAVIGKTIIMPDGRKSVIAIYQDITDRILIRKALEAEKTYFQNLFDSIPFGIVLLHPNGETADCNEGFVHLFQYSKKEIFNKGNIKIIIPDQLRLEGENYRKRVVIGEKVYFETQRLRKDGELIDVSITAKPLKRPDGESFVFAIFQDISLRKQAERALEESELQLSNLITNLPGMVYRCLNDEHYTMLYASEGSAKVTGYTPEQFIATNGNIRFGDLIVTEYEKPIKKIWDDCIKQKIPFEFQYQIITASGEIKWIWERGRGVFDENGNLLFLEGYIEDINEKKKAETALEKERELMQALMDNIPDTIYFKDRESRFIRINYTQARVLGVKKPEDAIGKTDLDFFQAEHADVSLLEEREMMESGISVVNKQEHIFTSNGWRWFTATKVPLY